ncbi:MAG TPA: co-chaperone GroES [Candidatus Saccharimonadales bacterium]|nr:co-chaperone GroES [Candidatus Saccharimonadales bacterium]
MKLQPLADRLVAKPLEAQAKTSSGFYVPDSAKEKPQMGEVVAVGKEVKEIKVGDQIVYSQYKPDQVKIDGDELMIMKEEDVLAIAKR